jgi:glyoxylase-like metal-dependent hydrolase (beta-lactamase superfamily II)
MTRNLVQLSDNIWLWPHNPDPAAVQASVGIITHGDECMLVDAGNGPALARQIKASLEEQGLPPVTRIVYTHHHWDHVYGACAFEAPAVAHAECRAILEQEAQKPWSSEYLREVIERSPKLETSYGARDRAIKDWSSFRIVLPETVFEEQLQIQLGQLTIELEHVGGRHASDSVVVRVPQARVIFIGDCYYVPPLHLREPDDLTPSIDMLAALESEAYELYVESHDDPFTRAELLEFLESV